MALTTRTVFPRNLSRVAKPLCKHSDRFVVSRLDLAEQPGEPLRGFLVR